MFQCHIILIHTPQLLFIHQYYPHPHSYSPSDIHSSIVYPHFHTPHLTFLHSSILSSFIHTLHLTYIHSQLTFFVVSYFLFLYIFISLNPPSSFVRMFNLSTFFPPIGGALTFILCHSLI
uniref:Uncharacterized protein n=1 Tax=Cacopsylla melanoneura TaxID=428564 RepID=A0A8D9EI33_9HEMI